MYLNKPATVDFDPNKKEHRAAFRAFMKRKAWTDCPMRFTHDPGYGSIAEQVQAKMLDWYIAQDEAKEARKPSQLRQRVANGRIIQSTGQLPSETQHAA